MTSWDPATQSSYYVPVTSNPARQGSTEESMLLHWPQLKFSSGLFIRWFYIYYVNISKQTCLNNIVSPCPSVCLPFFSELSLRDAFIDKQSLSFYRNLGSSTCPATMSYWLAVHLGNKIFVWHRHYGSTIKRPSRSSYVEEWDREI